MHFNSITIQKTHNFLIANFLTIYHIPHLKLRCFIFKKNKPPIAGVAYFFKIRMILLLNISVARYFQFFISFFEYQVSCIQIIDRLIYIFFITIWNSAQIAIF